MFANHSAAWAYDVRNAVPSKLLIEPSHIVPFKNN